MKNGNPCGLAARLRWATETSALVTAEDRTRYYFKKHLLEGSGNRNALKVKFDELFPDGVEVEET